ncbi:MAG TPA: YicC/YloC family endoribonuclease [Polyangia bacterium]|jgi:uncharacterized protein (TIGR00255 family)|nr:YicC/YloC family endoribonuclease [Polyangia bacterium]
MTGFGRATVECGEKRLRIEVRSVNHRGLDLKIRSQSPDSYCDSEIGRAVRAAAERGAITVSIREELAGPLPDRVAGAVDERRAREVFAALERLRRDLALPDPTTLITVAAFMGTSPAGAELAGEALWEMLRPGVEHALAELRATRAREGAALAADLAARAAKLRAAARAIADGAAALPERFARRLEERLASVRELPGFEPGRMAQEAALMAERLDVSEEITRLHTHLDHVEQILGEPGAVGRKLDFVIQEIGRELNTIGSKAQDAQVAGLVIDGKVELEKIREQAQNIE